MFDFDAVRRFVSGNSEITQSIRVYCKREGNSRKNMIQAIKYAEAFEADRENGKNFMTDVEIFAGAMSMAGIVLTEEISQAARADREARLREDRRFHDEMWGGSYH